LWPTCTPTYKSSEFFCFFVYRTLKMGIFVMRVRLIDCRKQVYSSLMFFQPRHFQMSSVLVNSVNQTSHLKWSRPMVSLIDWSQNTGFLEFSGLQKHAMG
jgi:hypothetical protein